MFRHTEENAELWIDVLARLRALVGDAAGRGPCYCATEPLDNPEYELFLQDYYHEFGIVPQTTTAAATRDIERTRRLLAWGQGTSPHFDRISVLSESQRDMLFDAFAPGELLLTDLLPLFPQAPAFSLQRAGRNLGDARERGSTIACASGFVINMYRRDVRLLTPVIADEDHPTGERILEVKAFTDGASLENAVR